MKSTNGSRASCFPKRFAEEFAAGVREAVRDAVAALTVPADLLCVDTVCTLGDQSTPRVDARRKVIGVEPANLEDPEHLEHETVDMAFSESSNIGESRFPLRTPGSHWPVIAAVALLIVSNVMANRVLPATWFVPWNMAITLALLGLATRLDHLTFEALGLGRSTHRMGLHWGAVLCLGAALVFGIGLVLPATRELFRDRRALGTGWDTLYRIFISVPLGTVAVEEIAFRAVLPAMLERRTKRLNAIFFSSFLFGVWHILPSSNLNRNNAVVRDSLSGPIGRTIAISAAVLSTTIVGLFFCWLRYRSCSLLTPLILHCTTNSLAYAGAWYVLSK